MCFEKNSSINTWPEDYTTNYAFEMSTIPYDGVHQKIDPITPIACRGEKNNSLGGAQATS